jgi:hypothetical protein
VVINSNNKTKLASFFKTKLTIEFYFRLTFFGKIIAINALVFITLSLISALGGLKTATPIAGSYIQNWFNCSQLFFIPHKNKVIVCNLIYIFG